MPLELAVDMYVEVGDGDCRLILGLLKRKIFLWREILPHPKPDSSNYYKLVEDALK